MMIERDVSSSSATTAGRLVDWPGRASCHNSNSVETAVAVEFVASLFCHTNDKDDSSSTSPCAVVPPEWNVTFPGLSLDPAADDDDDDGDQTNAGHHHHHSTTRHAAEVHAVTLLRRPIAAAVGGRNNDNNHHNNTSLRENAYSSFITLVNARLNAYVRRWPAMAGLLLHQYQMIRPNTVLSRLEVLQQQQPPAPPAKSATTTKDDSNKSTTKNTKLALCCWSMAMDLILEHPDASNDGPNDTTTTQQFVMSVSFSTLGSISRDSLRDKHLIVELDLPVLLAEMIRQASIVVSAMVQLVGLKSSSPQTGSAVPPPRPPPPTTTTTSTTKDLNCNRLARANPPPVHQEASSTGSGRGSSSGRCDNNNNNDDDVSMMPPPPPRHRKRPTVMVVSPDLSSTTAVHRGVVPTLNLDSHDDQSLSVDQCADIIDTCLTEFTPLSSSKRAKYVMSSTPDA